MLDRSIVANATDQHRSAKSFYLSCAVIRVKLTPDYAKQQPPKPDGRN